MVYHTIYLYYIVCVSCTCVLYSADCRMVKMLLSRGAQVNVADMAGNTPLHTATIYGHTELVKLLLQHAAEVYRKGQHGALAIHMAAHEGHANLVRLFCQFAEVYFLYFIHWVRSSFAKTLVKTKF